MADEFLPDDVELEEGEEMEDPALEELEEVEQTEQQRAEAADLAKLFRQHPEIWIPYSEQVQSQLNVRAPEPLVEEEAGCHLRELRNIDIHHCTYPFLTVYERTKCISYRASQICNGGKPYIVVPEGVTDAYEIAKLELDAKRLPYIIKRPIPDGSFEVWRLADLVML